MTALPMNETEFRKQVEKGEWRVLRNILYHQSREVFKYDWEVVYTVYTEKTAPTNSALSKIEGDTYQKVGYTTDNSFLGSGYYIRGEHDGGMVMVHTKPHSLRGLNYKNILALDFLGRPLGVGFMDSCFASGPFFQYWGGDHTGPAADFVELAPENFESFQRFVGKTEGWNFKDKFPEGLRDLKLGAIGELLVGLFGDKLRGLRYRASSPVDLTMFLFAPKMAEANKQNISIYQSAEKFDRDLRTSMKPGRAFRFMFPEATDAEVEMFVDELRKKFPVQNLVVKRGYDRADFKHMYTHDICGTQNIYTTQSRKSLACSCMRYKFNKVHPSEAYASGEFLALWTEDENGRIASRVVVHDPSKTFGPVYGTTEYSVDLLYSELHGMGYEYGDSGSWEGAEVLMIELGCEEYAFPYIDFGLTPDPDTISEGRAKIYDRGDDLPTGGTWCPNGDGEYSYCYDCDERVYEDDMYHDDDGYCYCESCYHERFSRCEWTDRWVPSSEIVEVVVSGWGGRTRRAYVCEDALDDFTLAYDDIYYESVLVVELGDSGEWAYKEDPDIFCSDLTGEYHHNDDQESTEDNNILATKQEFLDAGYVYNSDEGFWEEGGEDDAEAA